MNKKKLSIVSIVLLLAIILVVVLLIAANNRNNRGNEDLNNNSDLNLLEEGAEASWENESVEVFTETHSLSPIIAETPREDILENSNQPLKIVNLVISKDGFSPKEFKVKTGQVITLNLGVVDEDTHAFNFTDVELIASDVTVTPGYSLGFNIVAPLEAGSYSFHDALFPENTGRMIVE